MNLVGNISIKLLKGFFPPKKLGPVDHKTLGFHNRRGQNSPVNEIVSCIFWEIRCNGSSWPKTNL